MPKQKKEIISDNKNFILKEIQLNEKKNKYIVFDYLIFKDYMRFIKNISKKSLLKYNFDKKNKNIVEFLIKTEYMISLIKIPIIKTNIKNDFNYILSNNISFSKNNIKYIILIFKKDGVVIKYNFEEDFYIFNLTNNNFDYLYKNVENEKKKIKIYNKPDIFNFKTISIEKFRKYDDNIEMVTFGDSFIKNTICYFSITFDNLKEIFEKFDKRIKVVIKRNYIIFKGIIMGKIISQKIAIKNLNNNIEDKISFFINIESFLKLKNLTFDFNIIKNGDRKIFKKLEVKIILDKKNNYKGITIFPANFDENHITKINGHKFDIYNSIMLFIPQFE